MDRRMWIIAALLLIAALAAWVIWGGKPQAPGDARAENGLPVIVPGSVPERKGTDEGAADLSSTVNLSVGNTSMVDGTLSPDIDVKNASSEQLAALFKVQKRDPEWAPRAEASLRGQFAGIPVFGTSAKVTCATSICEITGQAREGASPAEADAAMSALQGADTDGAMKRFGFAPGGPITFNSSKSVPGSVSFTKYVARQGR